LYNGCVLTIRGRQLRELHQQHLDKQLDAVLRYVAERYPERFARFERAEARKHVAPVVARARRYGIVTTAGVGGFVSLCLVVSPRFDEHPKVRAILNGEVLGLSSVGGDARLEALGSMLSDADWQEAKALRSPGR
jgi:hypothetical protein